MRAAGEATRLMDAREQLRQWIDEEQGRLAAGIPPGCQAALLALVAAIDALPLDREVAGEADVLTGRRMLGLGVTTALRLALGTPGVDGGNGDHAAWADEFLRGCRDIEAARLALRLAESGHLRLAPVGTDRIDGWPIGRAVPASWRERADLDYWAASLSGGNARDRSRRERGADAVARMAYQLPYPADAEIGGLAVSTCLAVLAALIDLAAGAGEPTPLAELDLIADVARMSECGVESAGRALAALTLDADNAGWHAELPGGPQAPVVRIGPDRLLISQRGLLSEPLFFLARELRRGDPERWHNAAHLREAEFRRDLFALFAGSRFVTGSDPILLRWPDRRNRTDIDAAVFDRKTGTLGLFELKSQDPFARSVTELERQLENLRRAGRQVGAILDWINRNGADDVLNRMDPATARRFRVQRVLPFVLGRYLADSGERPGNRQIAWGSWGQVLRLREGGSEGNPLMSLHTRLLKDDPADRVRMRAAPPREISLGGCWLVVRSGGTAG